MRPTALLRYFCLLAAAAILASPACGQASISPSAGAAEESSAEFLVTDGFSLGTLSTRDLSRVDLIRFDDRSLIFDPEVSPDGRLIAFSRQPPAVIRADGSADFGSDIYVADRDGRNPRELVRHGRTGEFLTSAAWLNDGELLFATRGPGSGGKAANQVEKVSVSTGARAIFIQDGILPAVSPDGRFVVFNHIDPATDSEELVVVSADLRQRQTIVKDDKLKTFSSLVFSPDGSRIAFAAIDRGRQARSPLPDGDPGIQALGLHPTGFDIWMVNRDGSKLTRVSDLADSDPSVAFNSDARRLYVLGVSGLWRVDLAARSTQKLGTTLSNGQIIRIP